MSEKPPKPEPKEEDLVFVTSLDRYPQIYDWERRWNPDMIKQCQKLLKRLGWKQGAGLADQQESLIEAFDQARLTELRDNAENSGLDFSEIRRWALVPTIKEDHEMLVSKASDIILQNKRPEFTNPQYVGPFLERMVNYLETHK